MTTAQGESDPCLSPDLRRVFRFSLWRLAFRFEVAPVGNTPKAGGTWASGSIRGRQTCSKPFNPKEVRSIIELLQQPAVFLNMVSNWPALQWTAEHLSQMLDGKELTFRIGKRRTDKAPQFETQCEYIKGTLQEFLVWLHGENHSSPGLFSSFPRSEYWAYADYKYIAMMFEDKAEFFQDVIWADFGFPGRDGRESTLWIGSEAANTPCHLDSYGYNLVLQVQGRKRWHLFPPDDTSNLYPTRIPYEESSVFSSVNVANPDLERFPRFLRVKPHMVTLCPGEVLHFTLLVIWLNSCFDASNWICNVEDVPREFPVGNTVRCITPRKSSVTSLKCSLYKYVIVQHVSKSVRELQYLGIVANKDNLSLGWNPFSWLTATFGGVGHTILRWLLASLLIFVIVVFISLFSLPLYSNTG
ncbi:HSPB1-associated protein 1 homolog isoform X4 [Narcine bancroftii]|uniref:HSPB1-associated protein 1 homolog isoform X4 n=1 Tax=Narcine bancroftii TaxID=1343680 RepID=UPI003831419F